TKCDLITTEEFIFKQGKRIIEQDKDKGTITIKFFYKPQENVDYTSDLYTGEKLYGVISPKGEFYQCAYEGHRYLEPYLVERGILQEAPHWGVDAFEWNGFMKLTGAYMTTCEFVHQFKVTKYDFNKKEDEVLKETPITKEQVEAVIKYIKGLGRNFVNFNYYWYHINDFDAILDYEDEFEFSCDLGERELENEREELDKENPKE
ncbi:MAG: hypothetical protein PQJ49_04545, partial [Sphaerochaetaceae bacterium]|nr:hypothetical protein [Sphaerochaetaceae bacterium]